MLGLLLIVLLRDLRAWLLAEIASTRRPRKPWRSRKAILQESVYRAYIRRTAKRQSFLWFATQSVFLVWFKAISSKPAQEKKKLATPTQAALP
jgi:hypothetical protein